MCSDHGGRQTLVQVVDGFKVRFTHRTSWKAEIRSGMDFVTVAPVVWTIGRWLRGREIFLEVRFQDLSEMEQVRVCEEPFLVVLAMAEDYNQSPRRVRSFQGIFWVKSTGTKISLDGIETTVIGRASPHNCDCREPRLLEPMHGWKASSSGGRSHRGGLRS